MRIHNTDDACMAICVSAWTKCVILAKCWLVPWRWFSCKAKHVGEAFLILIYFNKLYMCISWTIKGLIHFIHLPQNINLNTWRRRSIKRFSLQLCILTLMYREADSSTGCSVAAPSHVAHHVNWPHQIFQETERTKLESRQRKEKPFPSDRISLVASQTHLSQWSKWNLSLTLGLIRQFLPPQ